MEDRPNQAWGERSKNAHFSNKEGGGQLASLRGVGVAGGAQMRAHGKLRKALEAWLKRCGLEVSVYA